MDLNTFSLQFPFVLMAVAAAPAANPAAAPPQKPAGKPEGAPGPNGNNKKNNQSDEGVEEISGRDDVGIGSLSSPNAVINLIIAAIFDITVYLVGWIPVVGWIIVLITNAIITFYFFLWLFFSSKGLKAYLVLLLVFTVASIPYLNDLAETAAIICVFLNIPLPTSWIGFVYTIIMGVGAAKKVSTES